MKELKKSRKISMSFDEEVFERLKKEKQSMKDVSSWEEFIYKKVLG